MANNEDYLNRLIAKAKKSWEGVDAERYMSGLRDNSFDKEVAENLSKEVASYITEQMKSNMDKAIIKCRDLMVGDWIADNNGFQWQITNVGDDYAYATFEGNEGDPWEFDDKDDHPEGIPLTKEMLDANGFRYEKDYGPFYRSILGSYSSEYCVCVEWREISEGRKICYIDCVKREDGRGSSATIRGELYVHTLQQALRLVGLSEIADNFNV